MILLLVGVIIVIGLLNPWTGLFSDTLYSPKSKPEPDIPEPQHKNFRLTK